MGTEDAPTPAAEALAPRPASASHVVLSQLMEVTDANVLGNVHGGVLMRLADTAAALAAAKHAGGPCVTVSVDQMVFREPVHVGDLVTFRASVNGVGTTSLECGVRIEAERLRTGEVVHASSAYFVYVAIDDAGRPRPVPPLVAETPEERRRQREAEMRRANRIRHREELERARSAAEAQGEEPAARGSMDP
ncbi:MAG: acyl-CoA thioesterase [Actinomycetota bacterium]|jgi:acyl-CoA hydrolase|nr:MAG: acyl-CoA thioesterase [Actinomycetota bacterium]